VGGASVDPEPLPSAFAPGQTPRERVEAGAERTRLTFRRLSGLDRSGPPPPATLAGQPLHPWTVPNAIGYVRLGLIPVFLRSGLKARDGIGHRPAALFAIIAWSDYADGIAARVTGQYSRFGALLDPVVDRLLVISGVVVCWRFELLPRWALAVLVARELFMLVAGRAALRRGVVLPINWWGRWSVWPLMSALFFGLCGLTTFAAVLLYLGLFLSLTATVFYVRDALTQIGPGGEPPSSSP
jgi:CDP-diacylglycerol--glycerol-3-phosphate 3-phosphatidyltransferase